MNPHFYQPTLSCIHIFYIIEILFTFSNFFIFVIPDSLYQDSFYQDREDSLFSRILRLLIFACFNLDIYSSFQTRIFSTTMVEGTCFTKAISSNFGPFSTLFFQLATPFQNFSTVYQSILNHSLIPVVTPNTVFINYCLFISNNTCYTFFSLLSNF